MKEPSCIVLGGGGFLGINLCRQLATAGYRVRAFGRRCLFPDALRDVDWYQGDFNNGAALASAMQTYEIVFHLVHATTPQSANLDMKGDLEQNVVSTLALLDISRKLGIKRIVFVSSGGTIYGSPKQIPTPETAPTEPIAAYGVSKLAIEKYLAIHEILYGLEYRILRVSNPFGPYQIPVKNQGVISALLSRGLRRETIEIWGDGSVVRDYVFVADVIAALEAALNDSSSERVFNIGSGCGRSLAEVIACVEGILGTRLTIDWRRGRSVDVPISVLAVERAATILGWTPTVSFESGLQRTLDWWRSVKV